MTGPDLEQIALSIVERVESHLGDGSRSIFDPVRETTLRQTTEALRQVWNARGAADVARLDTLMKPDDGTGTIGSIVSFQLFEREIGSLDC
jgi:hypothetical protein